MRGWKRIVSAMAVVAMTACGNGADNGDGYVAPDVLEDVSWTETVSETGEEVQPDDLEPADTVSSTDLQDDELDAAADVDDAAFDGLSDSLDAPEAIVLDVVPDVVTDAADVTLAYVVSTSLDHAEKCTSQGQISHNALALEPGKPFIDAIHARAVCEADGNFQDSS